MATVNDRWHVIVTREGRDWLAEVQGIQGGAHTFARTLKGLDKHVREIIVLGADLPDEAQDALEIDYEYRVDDTDEARRAAVATRRKARRLAEEAEQQTSALARRYAARGVAVRDIAAMLDISYQRVAQLAAPERKKARGSATSKSHRRVDA